MTTRMAKLVPWYHKAKDQCGVLTVKGPQCINSATFVAVSGKNGSSEETPACKPHSDILRLDGWKVRALRAKKITIR